MKKFLSVILAVSLMMSLLCVVPASAEHITTWPYYFEDFEDGANSMQSSVAATIVSGGVDGSAYAGQYTVPDSGNRDIKFFVGSTNNLIKTGDTFKATADIKLSKAITNSGATFYLHYYGGANSTVNSENFSDNGFLKVGAGYPVWKLDNTSTEWQKVSFEGVYTGSDVYLDGSMGVTVQFAKDASGEYTLTLDNVEVQVIRDTRMDPVPITEVIYENDFTDDMAGITYKGSNIDGCGLSLVTPADAEKNGTGQVLQMTDTDTAGHVKFDLNVGQVFEYNKYYLITYKARTVEAYDNSSGEAVAFGVNPGSKHRWTLGGKYFWELASMKNDNKWQDCALVLHMTNDEGGACDDGIISMQWWIMYQGTGSDTGTYQFDDIVIREVGGIYNGDFDDFRNFTNGYCKEVNNETIEDGGVSSSLETDWRVVANARLGQYNTGSLVTKPHSRTLYFDAIDGTASIARNAYLEAGQRYKFSAKIDPAGANSCGTLKVTVNYTYTDETEANSVEILRMAPTARGYKEYAAEFTTPENMAAAEIVVTELGTGADVSRFDTSENLAYYTDDWGFEKLPSADIPVVTASATTSSDAIATFAKTFTAPAEVTDVSVIKLTATKDGVKTYIGSTRTSVFTIPESYRTGYALAAEITPIGSNGYIGKVVTIEVPAVPEAPIVVDMSFTADENNTVTLVSPEAMSGKVIWAAYDGTGKMTSWISGDISVTAGGTATLEVPEGFVASGVVKIMLWNNMTDCKPLAEAIE